MSQPLADWLVTLVGIYAGVGLLFAIPFVAVGAGKVDPSAREGTWGFRILILPGAVAFWPLLLKRWMGGLALPPVESNPHRKRAGKAPEEAP